MEFKRTTLTLLLLTTPIALAQAFPEQYTIKYTGSSWGAPAAPVVDEARNLLYYKDGPNVVVYDLNTRTVLKTIKVATNGSHALALTPDGKTLVVLPDARPALILLNTDTWTPTPITNKASVEALSSLWEKLALTPDGKKAILLYRPQSGSKKVAVFDLQTQNTTTWQMPEDALAMALSPDGQHLAVSTLKRVLLVNPENGTITGEVAANTKNTGMVAVGFSPNSKKLVGVNDAREMFVWDVNTRTLEQTVPTPDVFPKGLHFSPNGRYVLLEDSLNSIEDLNLWDTTTWKLVDAPKTKFHEKYGGVFTSDGKTLYQANNTGIRVFDTSQLNPMDAQVLLNVEPQDAQLLVGGKKPKMDANGVAKIFSGVPVEVQVTKPFFKAFNTTLNLKGGETKNLNVVLERDKGTLSLTSTPRGATVWIDGEEKGKTPLKLSKFDAGEYTITLRLNDYRDFTQRVTVRGSQDNAVNAVLVLNPGIKITSKPSGAQVFIGDTLVCEKTPCTLRNLPPSIQEFTFKLDGYPDLKAKAVIPEEGTGNLDVTLKK